MTANDFIKRVESYLSRHSIRYVSIEADGNEHIIVSFPEYKRRYSVQLLIDAMIQNLNPMAIFSQIVE